MRPTKTKTTRQTNIRGVAKGDNTDCENFNRIFIILAVVILVVVAILTTVATLVLVIKILTIRRS